MATDFPLIVSFDVEEHYRIEAAAGLSIDEPRKAYDRGRVDKATRWLLDLLGCHKVQASFFIVGETARDNPGLVRDLHAAGHEIASHSWDHRRIHHLTPATFREDLRKSKHILEDLTGECVVGYRAPTFSIVRQTAWALDVLAEEGFLYDSSIFPIRHDRYGVPDAPRAPFLAGGHCHTILEMPPVTWRVGRTNLPVGGGGYFRLFPEYFLQRGLEQVHRECRPAVGMLYFHPWEFDPRQLRLPLGRLNRFRSYVGIQRSSVRLTQLLKGHYFRRAKDVAGELLGSLEGIGSHALA